MAQEEVSDSVIEAVAEGKSVRYCESYEALRAGNWQQLHPVTVTMRSRSKKRKWRGMNFQLRSKDKNVKKLLKKKIFAVMYGDTLLLNMRPYKSGGVPFGNFYAQAYLMNDGKLLVTYFDIDKREGLSAAHGMFGLVGGLTFLLTTSRRAMQQDVCYLVRLSDKKAFLVDDELMGSLLYHQPDLLKEFKSLKRRTRVAAETVIPFLERAGLMK
ncbi:MAG: hypothetical protein K6A82_07155 [Prevotella sp.]|nr:hypothetical protein [Prevotella sp.]